MFGSSTRPVSDFLPRILSHIDGIDSDMVMAYTMDSVIQFIRDTKILTEIVCFDIDPCIDSYKLHTTHRIMEVLSVRFFNNNRQVPSNSIDYRINGDTFYIRNVPACSDLSVEVELVVAPKRDSEHVADFIYEDWADAIVSLTLTKLYLLTDNEWYNPQGASNHMNLYQQLVRQARISKVTKHKPLTMRLANKRRL